ncbi:MAG: AbrB/MazE/SpoVT family DNA-binding domain-containing protein [Methylacidiphilales bacterium]|nr:AbrB/MazE/SpoVT family DNA-binding domain-containing protein [Candidatus Methylacidiphilales bacterium]
MTYSTLSPKHQTTLGIDLVRQLDLHPGMKLKQWVEGGRIILEPVPRVRTAFGALKPKRKFVSIEEETRAMEKAVGTQAARKDP